MLSQFGGAKHKGTVLSLGDLCALGKRGRQFIPLLPEDMETFRSLPIGHSQDLLVFRLTNGGSFNTNTLSKVWRRAIASLKKQKLLPQDFDVDLYGGCRHTSISLMENVTPEELRMTTGHHTVEAFSHYMRWQDDKSRRVFRQTSIKQGVRQVYDINSGPKNEKP